MKALLLPLLLLITFSPFAADAKNPDQTKAFKQVIAQGFIFQYKKIGKEIEVIITAPSTGWIAIGFDPVNKMQGANIIIGYVKDGKVVMSDDFGVSSILHRPDKAIGGKDDVKVLGGEEKAGRTTLHFSIPLNSGDPKDTDLKKGKHVAIFAYGRNQADNFNSTHYGVGVLTFDLD